MARILIIGTNSFIGTNFQRLSKFEDVDSISLIEKTPEEICFENYDVVLHLAAIVHQTNKIQDREYYKINRDLCLRVAEYSKKAGIKQFVFLSTVKVYGEHGLDSKVMNENSECFPEDTYGKSKYEAELGLKYLEDASFTVSIVRTPLVYGEGVKANMLKILQLVEKLSILPFGKLNNRRSITFVGNLIGFIDRIIEKRASGIFIAMDENSVSTTELVSYLAKSFNKKVILFKLPELLKKIGYKIFPNIFDRLFGSLEFDNTFTKRELNYKPVISTEQGIRKMVMAYENNK